MGRKIFITYKYGDTNVKGLPGLYITKVRDYVTELQSLMEAEDNVNKGELDGQSLADFEDEHIASKLRDRIYDSSVTVVMISPNMKDPFLQEKDQWMPWEISYSLKEHSRNGKTSLSNAVLAVVLPDSFGSYDYYMYPNPNCNSVTLNTNKIFGIMRNNMFNVKTPDTKDCNGNTIYYGEHSYIRSVKWGDFISNIGHYLDVATGINGNIDNYKIAKTI